MRSRTQSRGTSTRNSDSVTNGGACFARLPAEIRDQIWSLVFPSRTYVPYVEDEDMQPNYQSFLPWALLVCKEAYSFALRHRKSCIVWRYNKKDVKTWVDPMQDSLYINIVWYSNHFPDDRTVFETIVLYSPPEAFDVMRLTYWSSSLGPKVKNIRLVNRVYELNISRSSLGTLDDSLYLDLDKDSDMRLLQVLQTRYPCSGSWSEVIHYVQTAKANDSVLRVADGRCEALCRSEHGYYIWLRGRRRVHLRQAIGVRIVQNPSKPLEPHLITLRWADYKHVLSQIWAISSNFDKQPEFRRVLQLRLDS